MNQRINMPWACTTMVSPVNYQQLNAVGDHNTLDTEEP